MNRGTKKQSRLIYPPTEDWSDFENEKYEEFEEYLKDNNIMLPEWVKKRDKMRPITGEDYKIDAAAKNLIQILEWKDKNFPMVLTDNQKTLLTSGLYFVHGRDRSLRPITFFCPKIILDLGIDIVESLPACQFIAQYIIEHMFAVGKVENFVNVFDLAKLSFSSLPKKWIIEFIKSFSSTTYSRSRTMFLLNSGTAVMMMWSVVKIFVHPSTRGKLNFSKTGTDENLQKMCHPSQLQEKYGGEAEDLTVFWPPYIASDEYGVDIKKLKNKTEFDASLTFDDPLLLPDQVHQTKIDSVTQKIDYVPAPDPERESRSQVYMDMPNKEKKVTKPKKLGKSCCVIF